MKKNTTVKLHAILLVFILFVIHPATINAQLNSKINITGTVLTETGEALIGVNVMVEGLSIGTITDASGWFSINISSNNTKLIFSYLGYIQQTISVINKSTVKVILKEDTKNLDEVVVVGYGTQRKKDLTGAVGVVDAKEMKKIQTSNIGLALQGQVAGVSVTSSGEPGRVADVNIRGIGSFSNVGPLYVIDGMIVTGGQREFNVNDVETMQVLKDASATALYGARGANGVIVITTKKGKDGNTRIDFSVNNSIQSIAKKMDMMNSLEFLRINRQGYENANMIWPGEPQQGQVLQNTDWQDEFFKQGLVQDYNLSISGATKDANYLISSNVFRQDGVVKGPFYNRYALRVNTGIKKGKLSVGENFMLSRTDTRPMAGNPFIDLIRMPPMIPVKNTDGTWGTGSGSYKTYGTNPIGMQTINTNNQIGNRVLGNLFAEIEIFSNIKFKSNIGIEYFNWADTYRTEFQTIRYLESSTYINQLIESRGSFTTLIAENILTYSKKTGKHAFDALVGYTAQEYKWQGISAVSHDLVPDYWVLSAGNRDYQMTGGLSENAMLSTLGRINYNYDDKYLFQANVRRDGSSRFGENYRYGTFPSASVGWRISQENFYEPVKKIIDDLKIRASYGSIGDQQAIGDYDYATFVSIGEGGVFGQNQLLSTGAIQKGRSNPNLRWESKTTLNIGLDFTALQNHIYGSIEFFNSISNDLLVKLPVSWTDGTDVTPWTNYGKIQNGGIECNVGFREKTKDFKYNIGINITHIENKVLKLGESYREGGLSGVNRSEEGRSVGDFYLVKTTGIFQSWDEVFAYTYNNIETGITSMIQPNAKPGDIRYNDFSKDGKIDKDDREFIGSPFPTFEFGLQFSCEYKNFDMSLFLNGVTGNLIYNNTKFWLERMDETTNMPANLQPWTPENHSTTTPRAVIGPNDNVLTYSDRWVEKGDYLRIKNIQIGYNIPANLLKKTRTLDSFRVFIGVQNVFTLTNYSGFDPEISGGDVFGKGNDNGHFPPVRSFNAGIQIAF